MPIVFVHGVNNRDGDDYRDNVAGRNGFLREIVGSALGLSPDKLYLSNPYWGGVAAKFAWKMAVLPDASEGYEKFGGGDVEGFGRTVDLINESQIRGPVVENAKRNFVETVDLLYAAALAGATTEEDARDLATSYLKVSAYAAADPKPEWLNAVTDENFADVLNQRSNASAVESFGAGGVLDSLKEGLSRLVDALPDAGTALVGRLARKKLNTTVMRFTGDAFVYLTKRGTPANPGPIVKVVLDELRKATGEDLIGFQKKFSEMRRASLPPSSAEERFDHYYRLATNTLVPSTEQGKLIRVADAQQINARSRLTSDAALRDKRLSRLPSSSESSRTNTSGGRISTSMIEIPPSSPRGHGFRSTTTRRTTSRRR